MVFDYRPRAGMRRVQGWSTRSRPTSSPGSSAGGRAATSCWPSRRAAAGATCGPTDINAFIKKQTGGDHSAKDFRTWNATLLAARRARRLRRGGRPKTARKRAIARAVKEVAALPGQHAGGLPRLLHRPAGHRRLPGRRIVTPARPAGGGRPRSSASPSRTRPRPAGARGGSTGCVRVERPARLRGDGAARRRVRRHCGGLRTPAADRRSPAGRTSLMRHRRRLAGPTGQLCPARRTTLAQVGEHALLFLAVLDGERRGDVVTRGLAAASSAS